MEAMLFSAGLGTRLRPLTDSIPKALVQIAGKTLLQWNIEKLKAAGYQSIVVNVHHFSEKIKEYISENKSFGIDIHISDESEAILDTGGGLLRAMGYFSGKEPVLCHNVDVISNLDIRNLAEFHRRNNALATLAVRNRETQRYLLFDSEMRLTGWLNKSTGERKGEDKNATKQFRALAFSGIHMIDPGIFHLFTRQGKFSVIDAYLDLAARHVIVGYEDTSSVWFDVGKPEQLTAAGESLFKSNLH
jgi:NDP-sugar pyrophosphorylase family protein